MYDGGWPPQSQKGLTGKEMLDVMDTYGISKVWISPVTGLVKDFKESNNNLYDFTRINPERFVMFCTVNPNYPEEVVSEIKRCVEVIGCKGLKLHPWLQAFSLSYKIVNEIVETCIENNLPIMFHDGTPPYSDCFQIASIAEAYPEAKIILGHAGLLDFYRNAVAAAKRFSNIYLCLCGPAIGDVKYILKEVDNNRLLFGTDFGSKSTRIIDDFIGIIDNAVENDVQKNKILYENACRLICMPKGSRNNENTI
jgi:Predicted metal-dependent hydrolase of the TIM-barrel fold